MDIRELAIQQGGCGEIIDTDAWFDAEAVPATAGLCDSQEKHVGHAKATFHLRNPCDAPAPAVGNGIGYIGCSLDVNHPGDHEARIRWIR
jgi:hypothetical protein